MTWLPFTRGEAVHALRTDLARVTEERDVAIARAKALEIEIGFARAHLTVAQDLAARLTEDRALADARYEALLDRFTTLRVAGAVPEPQPLPPPKELDALDKALSLKMVGMPYAVQQNAFEALAQARAAIDAGFVTEQDVLEEIRRGVQSDGVPG